MEFCLEVCIDDVVVVVVVENADWCFGVAAVVVVVAYVIHLLYHLDWTKIGKTQLQALDVCSMAVLEVSLPLLIGFAVVSDYCCYEEVLQPLHDNDGADDNGSDNNSNNNYSYSIPCPHDGVASNWDSRDQVFVLHCVVGVCCDDGGMYVQICK